MCRFAVPRSRGLDVNGSAKNRLKTERRFSFVDAQLRAPDGRRLHSWYRGSAAVPAYLDDHIFLAWGAVELYKATYQPKYLQAARQLIVEMDEQFGDDLEGGYFYTAHDSQPLPIRPKRYGDAEVPSGNSVATLVLSELARLTGETEYEDKAAELERLLTRVLVNSPSRATLFGVAVQYRRSPSAEVVIVGPPGAPETKRMLSIAEQHPSKAAVAILLRGVTADTEQLLAKVAPFTQFYGQIDGKPTAYVCHNQTCRAPTNDPQVMLRQLEELVSVTELP